MKKRLDENREVWKYMGEVEEVKWGKNSSCGKTSSPAELSCAVPGEKCCSTGADSRWPQAPRQETHDLVRFSSVTFTVPGKIFSTMKMGRDTTAAYIQTLLSVFPPLSFLHKF